jgi:uncharacterized protein (TIGR02246 family)
MKKTLFTIAILTIISCQCKHHYDSTVEEATIRQVLDDQVSAWNEGNIDAFMEGYLKSEDLKFVSSGTVRQGWQETINRYKTNYNTREKMGKLKFDIIDLRVLDHDDAHVLGKYYLSNAQDSVFSSGHFTLLWKKVEDNWVIAMDHTGG